MSSNKTVIPGMEDAYADQSFFSKANGPQNGANDRNHFEPNAHGANKSSHKPIVGFLYSISKSNVGEYWPLYLGSNVIGRSSNSNICLGEATVSEQHAVLVVQQLKSPEKVIAWISDSGSTCGTMVNGSSLGFDKKECFNGDLITIGEHYELFLILVDAKHIGLSVCGDFIPVQTKCADTHNPFNISNPYAAPKTNRFTQGFQEGAGVQGGTVGMDEPINGTPFNDDSTIFK